MLCLTDEIGRRIDSRKRFEVVNEVCLVEVAAGSGQIDPIVIHTVMNQLQDLLKAANARVELRRQSNLAAEKLNETARTQTNLFRHFAHRARRLNFAEECQRKAHSGMPLQRLERTSQQTLFQHLKLRLRRGRSQQPLAQETGFSSPQIRQRHVEILQLVSRQFEKWKRSARLEMYAHHAR